MLGSLDCRFLRRLILRTMLFATSFPPDLRTASFRRCHNLCIRHVPSKIPMERWYDGFPFGWVCGGICTQIAGWAGRDMIAGNTETFPVWCRLFSLVALPHSSE